MPKDVIVIGAGGHGKVIADIILKSGDNVFGFLDEAKSGQTILDFPVLGMTADCGKYRDKYFIIAIGNNAIREKIAGTYDLKYYTAIHPSAQIAIDTEIGAGTCVMANTAINTSAKIGKHCIINTGAVIEHDCILGDYVHISPNVSVAGTTHIGMCSHIGVGACIRNNTEICDNCVVGAGAAVVENIKEEGIYVGVPAKKMP